MKIQNHPLRAPRSLTAALLAAVVSTTAAAQFAPFTHAYQVPASQEAQFNVSGAATGGDLEGDAFLDSVVYTSGLSYTEFYRPESVTDLTVPAADTALIAVRGGTNITVGRPGVERLDAAASATDFADLMYEAFANQNLNHYVDIGGRPEFSFVVAFERPVRDDDPTVSDAHGELLYLERGTDGGNSWLTMQAVDAFGVPLGPELAVSPEETFPTTPVFSVRSASQKIGGLAIDVSRLGVSEVQYLKLRETQASHAGYAPVYAAGIDFQPDFKLMAVITHPDDLVPPMSYD